MTTVTRRRGQVLGDVHPETLQSVNNCGMLLHASGRPAAAEPLLREALSGRRQLLGPTHPDTLFSTFCLGAVLKAQGKAEAETVVVMAVQVRAPAQESLSGLATHVDAQLKSGVGAKPSRFAVVSDQ